jgi:hypothetical protein
MNQAIENHVLEHIKKNRNRTTDSSEADHIRDELISQLFKKIVQSKN